MAKAEAQEPPQDEASVADVAMWAIGYIALAAASCWVLHMALARGLGVFAAASFGKQGEWQAAVQPFAAGLKTQLELVVGPLARLTIGLDTVVGVACLLALLTIARSLARANEISLQRVAAARKSKDV